MPRSHCVAFAQLHFVVAEMLHAGKKKLVASSDITEGGCDWLTGFLSDDVSVFVMTANLDKIFSPNFLVFGD